MYIEHNSQLRKVDIITIEPIGGVVQEQIMGKLKSLTDINEEKLEWLSKQIAMFHKSVKNNEEVPEEVIISLVEEIEKEFDLDSKILSSKIRALFELGDGSKHNLIVALDAVYSVWSIIKIHILKMSLNNKKEKVS